ncbi:MAG: TRAP transporter substrate-binding protein DctP [Elusimicrobiota bacterium]|jgi:tripartite ATP-independent transporter DctP family solute receptor|nr:TRAP transporter substrate-binding protein DctP [Elusimicrobiota bacterium]
MKKLAVFSVVAALAFVIISCGGSKKSSGPIVWKLAFNQSADHPQAKALQKLSDDFFEATKGRYRIEVNPNELLGDQKTSFESVQNGTIQMAMLGNPVVEAAAPDFGLLALPGLYDSPEHQTAVFKSGILKDLFTASKDKHFIVLAAVHGGTRNVYAKKPVRSPADLKGMKIRVMQSKTMLDVLNAMGANAVGMSQGEVYSAIQQGVLDGAENNEVTFNDLKQYEVAPVYSYTRHFMMPDLLVINTETYNSLSPEDKAAFDKLIDQTIDVCFANFMGQIEKAKAEAAGKGAQFIDDFDSSVFKKNFEGLVKAFIGNNAVRRDLYNKIRATAKK